MDLSCRQFEAVVGPPSLVVVLETKDTTVVARVLARAAGSGRQGDALRGKVEERVEVHHTVTGEVVREYRHLSGRLEAEGEVEEVYVRMEALLSGIQGPI